MNIAWWHRFSAPTVLATQISISENPAASANRASVAYVYTGSRQAMHSNIELGHRIRRSALLYHDHLCLICPTSVPTVRHPCICGSPTGSSRASRLANTSQALASPERELAQDFGVAYDTVRRAAALLRERGLILTVHGRGTYVAYG